MLCGFLRLRRLDTTVPLSSSQASKYAHRLAAELRQPGSRRLPSPRTLPCASFQFPAQAGRTGRPEPGAARSAQCVDNPAGKPKQSSLTRSLLLVCTAWPSSWRSIPRKRHSRPTPINAITRRGECFETALLHGSDNSRKPPLPVIQAMRFV